MEGVSPVLWIGGTLDPWEIYTASYSIVLGQGNYIVGKGLLVAGQVGGQVAGRVNKTKRYNKVKFKSKEKKRQGAGVFSQPV
jgi:hypothetical protein